MNLFIDSGNVLNAHEDLRTMASRTSGGRVTIHQVPGSWFNRDCSVSTTTISHVCIIIINVTDITNGPSFYSTNKILTTKSFPAALVPLYCQLSKEV